MQTIKNSCKLAVLLAIPLAGVAQKNNTPIYLANPSFEDTPRAGRLGGAAPSGWYDCGKPGESAPDVQPGFFQVNTPASHGSTYMGLVVRDNETWEAVSQRLSRSLEAGQQYEWSIDLARDLNYRSQSRTTNEEMSYSSPVKLRVWGGKNFCDRSELLGETSLIVNSRWLTYNIRLTPKKGSYTYFIIEAYYKTPILFPYNGNLLVDNASPIRVVTDKPNIEPIAKTTPKPVSPKRNQGPPPVTQQAKAPPATPVPDAPQITDVPKSMKIDVKNLKKGDVIQIQNLYFDADKFDVKDESLPTLNDLYVFLKANPQVIVEIGGHTNNLPSDGFADQLSTNRAKAVADWLASKGIDRERIPFKGYGKKFPLDSNLTPQGRKRNQRVELKIL